MQINERAKQLVDIRAKIDGLKETMDILKGEKDNVQRELMEELGNLNLKSFKNDEITVSKSIRKTLQITDEIKLIEELESKGLKNEYVSEQIRKDLWKGFATQLVKDNKIMEGTEIRETEFLSIRNNKK